MSTAGAHRLPRAASTGAAREGRSAAGTDAQAWPHERTAAFVARTWGGYGALGTGLLLVALGAEHLRHHPGLSALLVPLGAATLAAAVLSLRGAGRHLRPGGVLTAVSGAAAVLAGLGTGRTGTAELIALGLGVLAGVLLVASAGARGTAPGATVADASAATAPQDPGRRATAGAGGTWSRLALLALGALVASAATVQGLAATEAGEYAVPHGLHGGGHHGG